jgi:hypothetical protein
MGDPITVGGGGTRDARLIDPVICDFSETIFTDRTGGAGDKHRDFVHKDNLFAKSLKITLNGTLIDFSALLPATGECKVEIKCPGVNDDVTITGAPLAIRLHTGVYRPDPTPGTHRRTGPSNSNEIEINVGGQIIKIQPKGDFEVAVETA